MEEPVASQIEKNKRRAEQTLMEILVGNEVNTRWEDPGHVGSYTLWFSVDGGKEEKIVFSHLVMMDGRSINDPHYIENVIRQKIESLSL